MYGSIKNAIRAMLAHLFGSTISKRRTGPSTGQRRAAVYARSATVTAHRNSIARQTAAAVEYARRNELDVVAVHVDDGVSGLGIDRPGLGRLLDNVASDRISVVIVEDLERIARSPATLLDVYKRLTASGVQLHAREEVMDMSQVAFAAVQYGQ